MKRWGTRVAPARSGRWSVRVASYTERAAGSVECRDAATHGSDHQQYPDEATILGVGSHMRLAQYMQWLIAHGSPTIDHQYVSQLLDEGADVNAVYGCSNHTALHDVAARWNIAVAAVLLERHADVNAIDDGDRTPLHFAAYTNNVNMVELLLDHGGNLEAKTLQHQTPIHYAVRGDAVDALHLLVERGGRYDVSVSDPHSSRDSRGRTPLQLAAELDCTIVARYLLSLEDHPASCAVSDYTGHPALVSMITHMPKLAGEALGQLHKTYPSQRSQGYHIGVLESAEHTVKTVFEAAVEQRSLGVLTHTVMQKLTSVRWTQLVRKYFAIQFSIYVLFLLTWSAIVVYPSLYQQYRYTFPGDLWRVGLQLIAVLLLIAQICDEVYQFSLSVTKYLRYSSWLQDQLEDDLRYMADDIFTAERIFLQTRLSGHSLFKIHYFRDSWNYVDLVTYTLLVVTAILHVADILAHTELLARWTMRVAAIGVILIWIRLLKFARVSSLLGPLVAIFGQLRVNIFQYFIVYMIVFIPYIISFWGLFSSSVQQTSSVNGTTILIVNTTTPPADLSVFYRVPVYLFRMSLIDEYPYNDLRDIDELMATLLVVSFLSLTAVIGLNLFIALLSDTFQRVYDNAQANAELQCARHILLVQDMIPQSFKTKFHKHLQTHCTPLTVYYDDDDEEDVYRQSSLLKITHQIYRALYQYRKHEAVTVEQVDQLTEVVADLTAQLNTVSTQVTELRALLETHLNPPSTH